MVNLHYVAFPLPFSGTVHRPEAAVVSEARREAKAILEARAKGAKGKAMQEGRVKVRRGKVRVKAADGAEEKVRDGAEETATIGECSLK